MKPVTSWYKLKINNEGEIVGKEYDHFEYGWSELDYPRPFSPEFLNQVAWKNDKWGKKFKWL